MQAALRLGVTRAMLGVALLGMGATGANAQAKKPAAPAIQLTGPWRAGATAMDVEVESWGTDCGPRPTSSRSSGGGVVNVTHSGKQVGIRSRDSEVKSDACWSRNPSMRRVTSSLVDNVWTTVCRTPQKDPREESGTYVLKVMGPDTLLYQDKSRYNWALNTSKCVATFTTTQTLTRVKDAQPAPQPMPQSTVTLQPNKAAPQPSAASTPQPTADPAEAPERKCTPGAPAHIAVRPKRADIEVAQRTCFRARVTDAADCAIQGAPVQWSLSHSPSLRGSIANGCFTAADTTAEAEGEFKVVATLSGLRAEASVSVRSVDLSALIAKRVESGALTGFEEKQAVVAPPKAAARIATRSVAERPKDKTAQWAALGAAVLALGGLSAFLLRRKPSAAPRTSSHSDRPASRHASHGAPSVPPRMSPETPIALEDEFPASSASRSQRPSSAPPSAEAWICPLCRLGYPSTQKTCPRDGSALMPYAEFNKRSQESAQENRMRCPKCGTLYPANASFCAEDGGALVDAPAPEIAPKP